MLTAPNMVPMSVEPEMLAAASSRQGFVRSSKVRALSRSPWA
jgi:hypothetical protein